VQFFRSPKGVSPDIELTPVMRDRIEKAAFSSLAGPAAECRFRDVAPDEPSIVVGSEDDRHTAIDYAERIAGFEERALNAYLNWMGIVVDNMVENPVNWDAIQHVAAALLERQTLSYESVQRAVFGDKMIDWAKSLREKMKAT
jgi:hypothetical protein